MRFQLLLSLAAAMLHLPENLAKESKTYSKVERNLRALLLGLCEEARLLVRRDLVRERGR